ncbi:MAG: hypothetical protein JWL84_5428 [Rhodospirillales bacterium]|jgi:hypothetical protein|nr:hypothetical protein [Rhodospirillales bacterium]
MTTPVLHVVFNLSAAMSLRQAVRQAGRDDRVVALADDLSFGPIDPCDGDARAQWVEAALGYCGWDEVGREAAGFWTAALSGDNRRIAWMSRRSAQEYAGFLEFVWRLGDTPCQVIDLTEFALAADQTGAPISPRPVGSLGMMPTRRILENQLLDRVRDIAAKDRGAGRARGLGGLLG